MQAYLILANGRVFRGVSVGCPGTTIGEVVFATGMVGFEETLTDPSSVSYTPATTARSSPRPIRSSATTA